jgi:hypothetical protein
VVANTPAHPIPAAATALQPNGDSIHRPSRPIGRPKFIVAGSARSKARPHSGQTSLAAPRN